jgi:hypothetical protein
MSAFVVEDRTINRAIGWLNDSERRTVLRRVLEAADISETDPDWMAKLGASMYMMNVEAVNQRYNEHEQPGDYEHHWELCSTVQAYKALRCFLYQCSEGDVPERALYKALHQAAYAMAHEIVSDLDAYEKAEW